MEHKVDYYLTAFMSVENGKVELSDFMMEHECSAEDALKGARNFFRVVIAHVQLEANTKEEFLEIISNNCLPKDLEELNNPEIFIEPDWVVDGDILDFMDEGKELFGITDEEMERATDPKICVIHLKG